MNRQRFQHSPAGRLVQATDDKPYWAFVPHPLPPPLELDNALARKLSEANLALGELAGLGRRVLDPQLLINPFIRREAVLSSRIEGTVAGISDLYEYEAAQLALPNFDVAPTPAQQDVQEVLNYVRALEEGLKLVTDQPVSLWLIRALHAELMSGVRGGHAKPGEFRTVQNVIGRAGATVHNARFVPPPVIDLQDALQALEQYIQTEDENDYPPLLRLALIHYQFEAIHPFEDGNGRTGRLLITLLLVHWGLLPQPLLYLSAFFERHQDEYRDLLLAVSEWGAWREWVLFFLEGVAEQAKDGVMRAQQLLDLRDRWRDELTQARGSTLLLRLVDQLFRIPAITVPIATSWLDISPAGTQRIVDKLVAARILRRGRHTRQGVIYVADAILAILWDI